MPRCPNGSRRNKSTGNCEPARRKTAKTPSPARNKTVKSRSPSHIPIPKPEYTYNEFCNIASELYGLSYTFVKGQGDLRHLYYVYNRTTKKFVFPKDLKKIMIGSPMEKYHTRTPYTGKAIKNKNGVSANVLLKDMNKNDLYNTQVRDIYAQRYKAWEK
jgi:hypothetical protein